MTRVFPTAARIRRPVPVRPHGDGSPGGAAAAHSRTDWVNNLPLVGVHLTPLAVIWVGVDARAVALWFGCYLVHMFGITAGFHRLLAHRSYKTSRWFQFVLAWLGCTAFEKGPLWWAAHHRTHHTHTDRDGDAHSPVTRGVWWAHIGWLLDADCGATRTGAVRDLAKLPELRWLDRHYWVPPVVLAGGCLLIGGWTGLVWGAGIATLSSLHAVFLVNSACHLWGRRRFATSDASRNNALVAVLTLGEGWHNNHHHYQSSVRQGFRWWEVDVSYYLLRGLAAAGLVWGLREPPAGKLSALVGVPNGGAHPRNG